MQKGLILVIVVFVLGVLAAPWLLERSETRDAQAPAVEEVAALDGQEAPAPAAPPQPPLWNAANLVGTAWVADMSTAPSEDHRGDLLFQFHFAAPGQLDLEIVRAEEPEQQGGSAMDTFFQGLMHTGDGAFEVHGAEIHLSVRMATGWSDDTIEIRGQELFYHGVPLQRLR